MPKASAGNWSLAPAHDGLHSILRKLNARLGNEFGGTLSFVSDDAGTPFAVTPIPTDDELA